MRQALPHGRFASHHLHLLSGAADLLAPAAGPRAELGRAQIEAQAFLARRGAGRAVVAERTAHRRADAAGPAGRRVGAVVAVAAGGGAAAPARVAAVCVRAASRRAAVLLAELRADGADAVVGAV